MRFTDEQFKTLSQFETHFRTAVKSSWTTRPSSAGLQLIHSIYTTATGDRRRLNGSCGNCILNLIRDCGQLYFKEKEERQKMLSSVAPTIVPKTPQNGLKIERKDEKSTNPLPKPENARKRGRRAKTKES